MLLFVPLGLGCVIGIFILGITIMLKKKFTSKSSIIKIPAYIGAIGSILLISIGLFVVRGFEGAAYLFLAITILAFAVMTFKQLAK